MKKKNVNYNSPWKLVTKTSTQSPNKSNQMTMDPEPETSSPIKAMSIDSTPNSTSFIGTKGRKVKIFTNRVNILSIPDTISVFHLSFPKDTNIKIMNYFKKPKDLVKTLPIAYDGSKILIQYDSINTIVHKDTYIIDNLKPLILSNKLIIEKREDLKLDFTSRDLTRVELQYLDIIFSNNLPKEILQSLSRDKNRECLNIKYKYKSKVTKGESSPQLSIDVQGSVVYKQMTLEKFLRTQGLLKGNGLDSRRAQKALLGLKVLPTHRKGANSFTIKGITREVACKRTFNSNGVKDNVYDFFKKTYPRVMVNKYLPCVIASIKKSIFYPIECLMVVSEQKFTKEIPRYAISKVHLPPNEREKLISEGIKGTKEIVEEVKDLKVSTELIKVDGREINNRRSEDKSKSYFVKPMRVKKWLVILADDSLNREAVDMGIDLLVSTGKYYGMEIGRPMGPIVSRNVKEVLKRSDDDLEFILLIKHEFDKKSYDIAKKFSWLESSVPIQVCLSRYFKRDERSLRSYMKNLILKVNVKLGGSNFKPKQELTNLLPLGRTLVLGMDACHGDINSTMKSGNVNIATMALIAFDPHSNRYYSAITSQQGREDVLEKVRMIKLLSKLRLERSDYDSVVFFRDGVGETMVELLLSKELEGLCSFFSPETNINYVIFNKRHKTRFFRRRNGEMVNPNAGTVIDSVVTNKDEFDFYLQAHRCNLGSAKLPHYVVMRNDDNFSPDDMQSLANELSKLYQRSFGSVSQTCVAYCSHVLAEKCRLLLGPKGNLPELHRNLSPLFFL